MVLILLSFGPLLKNCIKNVLFLATKIAADLSFSVFSKPVGLKRTKGAHSGWRGKSSAFY